MRERLLEFVDARTKVRLTRGFPSEPLHNGFVLALGREWVLLHQFHDFYPEGYTAIRVKDITDIRSGEYERHWERMLAAEGLLDKVAVHNGVSLENVSQMLRSLQAFGHNVIVECEDRAEDVEDFYIGQILSVDEDSVSFANFDGLGHWDDLPDAIPFEEITKVQFDTPYVQTFSKYLEGPCIHTRDADGGGM